MHAHIPTIFFVIIAISFALAAAILLVSWGRKRELLPLALGMALHGLAYLLFSLRGEISDFLSIVVANTAIATLFALFAEGLRNFAGPRPRNWFLWLPVPFIAAVFPFLMDDLYTRTLLSSLIFMFQAGLLAWFAQRSRKNFPGRGQFVVISGAALVSVVMLLRLVGALNGTLPMTSITTSSPIQTITFLMSIVSTLLVVIGVLLMTWERDEQLIRESEQRMRTLFESTSDAVMLLDERGFFDCNPATLKVFGCPSREIFTTKHPADLSPPQQPCGTDSQTLAAEHIRKAMRESSDQFEWMHMRLDDGRCFPAEVLLNSMHLHGRHVLQAVVRDITERKRMEVELQRQAHLDALTGLANRGYFMQRAELEFSRALRYGKPLSLLMLDIDHFKTINDSHGHQVGDAALRKFAEVCRSTLRDFDLIGRLGGEEFAVILPETDIAKTREVAERLRESIATSQVALDSGAALQFTTSIGIATLQAGITSLDTLLARADRALYQAKAQGRNRVEISAA